MTDSEEKISNTNSNDESTHDKSEMISSPHNDDNDDENSKSQQQEDEKNKNNNSILERQFQYELEQSKRCQRQIETKWRKILRTEKLESLQNDIHNVLREEYSSEVDRKKNLLFMVLNRLDVAEDQIRSITASHLQTLDELIDLHDDSLIKLERNFEKRVNMLRHEQTSEWSRITKKYKLNRSTILDEMTAIENDERASVEEDARERQQMIEEIKNKNLEELNNLRFFLDSKIEDLEEQFEVAQNEYLQKTDAETESLQNLQAKDKKITKEIHKMQRQIDNMQVATKRLNAATQQNKSMNEDHHKQLIQRKGSAIKAYTATKAKIEDLRGSKHSNLKAFIINANECRLNLEEKCELGESLLKIGEHVTKLEKQYCSEGICESEGIVGPALIIKKTSQVLLDLNKSKEEESILQRENQVLKNKLKKYHDGITVNNDVICANNPLIVINGKMDPAVSTPISGKRMAVVDANHAFAISHVR